MVYFWSDFDESYLPQKVKIGNQCKRCYNIFQISDHSENESVQDKEEAPECCYDTKSVCTRWDQAVIQSLKLFTHVSIKKLMRSLDTHVQQPQVSTAVQCYESLNTSSSSVKLPFNKGCFQCKTISDFFPWIRNSNFKHKWTQYEVC